MWVFIQVLTRDNYKALLADKDGWRLRPNLEEVWEAIFMDYTERIDDPNSQRTFQIIKTIRLLSNNITIAEQCIDLLTRTDDLTEYQPTIKALKEIVGYYGQFTEETILKDLKQCISRIKLMRIRYNEAMTEYKSLETGEQTKAKEADFTEQIVAFEQAFGVPIDIRNISVAKYISYLSAYKSKFKDG